VVEIRNFSLTLESKEKKLYPFADRLSCFANITPVEIKAIALAENSYYGRKYNCDHGFSIELHLCHFFTDMLEITNYGEIDIRFDAVYINTFD